MRATPDENLAMIGDTVRYLKDHGKFVIYDAEHASTATRTNRITPWPHGRRPKKPARISSCSATPTAAVCRSEIARHHELARKQIEHAHRASIRTTISGSASPTRLAALEAGATHVQGTINGYGERTGNCNLTSVIPNARVEDEEDAACRRASLAQAQGTFAVRG